VERGTVADDVLERLLVPNLALEVQTFFGDSATDSSAWTRAGRVLPSVEAMPPDSKESSSFFAIVSDAASSARGTGDAI